MVWIGVPLVVISYQSLRKVGAMQWKWHDIRREEIKRARKVIWEYLKWAEKRKDEEETSLK